MDNPLDSDGLPVQPAAQPAPKPVEQPVPEAVDTPIAADRPQSKGNGKGKPPKKRVNVALYVGIVVVLLAAAAGGGFFLVQNMSGGGFSPFKKVQTAVAAEQPQGPLKGYVKGSIAHMVTYAAPKTITDIPFIDRDKKTLKLSDFKGQVVVLNVWATWCAPCRFEMPTLAHLQTEYTGKGLKVIPLSVDTADKFDDVKSFIDVQDPLEVYADTKFAAPSTFNIAGMPATFILDKQGRLVARLDGEATWDTPEVKALMDKLLSE